MHFYLFKEWRQVSSSHNCLFSFKEWMCLSGFLLLPFFIYKPPLPCPHHHWATVEVVSRREMMPNLTGVEPYLYSLHSRFCFKGFVYTRPINHLLPSHNPTAFKVCSTPGDNTQHRCQCKSHLLRLPMKRRFTDLCSRCPLSFLCYLFMAPSALITISNYRTHQVSRRELWLQNICTSHTWAWVCLPPYTA